MKPFWTVLLCCAWLCAALFTPAPVRAQAVPPADAAPFEVLATLGGQLSAVAVDGQRAYLGEGASLVVLDISNPAAPTPLGRAPLEGKPQAVVAGGGYAYALVGTSLWTLDLRNPAQPLHTGTFTMPNSVWEVQISDGILVVSAFHQLLVFGLDDPAHPTLLSIIPDESVVRIQLTGRRLAMLHADQGLIMADLSEPSAPVVYGSIGLPLAEPDVRYEGLAFDGDRAVIAAFQPLSGTWHLLTIDVSKPGAPVIQGIALLDTKPWALAGDLLVAMEWPFQIQLFDISHPGDPVLLSGYPLLATQLLLRGDQLYALGEGRLLILDVAAPPAPVLLGRYDMSGGVGNVQTLRLAGQRLYAINPAVVQIIDVSQPRTPMLQGQIPVDKLRRLLVVGDWLYLLDGTTLRIIDVSNPASPVERTTLTEVQDVQAEGGLAYLVSAGVLRIYSIADPGRPALLSMLAVPSLLTDTTMGVWVASRRAYVGRFQWTSCGCCCQRRQIDLAVVDVADPSKPQLHGHAYAWTLPSRNDPLAIVGTTFYQAQEGILIDASDPDNPVERHTPALENVQALQTEGARAYGVTRDSLRALDLTDPLNPRVLNELPLASVQPSLALSAGRLFLAAEGLRVFDLSDPASPQLRASHVAPVVDLAVDRQYVYLALAGGGLRILRLDPAVFPLPLYLPQIRKA